MSDLESKRYQLCESCSSPVDTMEPGVWKTPNDEQWYHDECYDKLGELEDIRDRIVALISPIDVYDGLSGQFHDDLDGIQAELDEAIQRERLRQEQELVDDE